MVTSLERDLTLPGSIQASKLSYIDTVTAPGPYMVVIHLKSRYSPFFDVVAGEFIMSPTQLAKLGANFGSDPVCVGPFMYDSTVAGVSYTVIKSPYYYDRLAVHLDKIVFDVEADPAAAVAALQAGSIQVLDSISGPELATVQQASA